MKSQPVLTTGPIITSYNYTRIIYTFLQAIYIADVHTVVLNFVSCLFVCFI